MTPILHVQGQQPSYTHQRMWKISWSLSKDRTNVCIRPCLHSVEIWVLQLLYLLVWMSKRTKTFLFLMPSARASHALQAQCQTKEIIWSQCECISLLVLDSALVMATHKEQLLAPLSREIIPYVPRPCSKLCPESAVIQAIAQGGRGGGGEARFL